MRLGKTKSRLLRPLPFPEAFESRPRRWPQTIEDADAYGSEKTPVGLLKFQTVFKGPQCP